MEAHRFEKNETCRVLSAIATISGDNDSGSRILRLNDITSPSLIGMVIRGFSAYKEITGLLQRSGSTFPIHCDSDEWLN
jgi:hypothetical protein